MKKSVSSQFYSDVIELFSSQPNESLAKAEQFKAQFGVYVGFYNRTAGTRLSVEEAFYNETIRKLYATHAQEIAKTQPKITPTKRRSTRSLAREEFEASGAGNKVRHKIYRALINVTLSRKDLENQLGLCSGTVCSAIALLVRAGLVAVVGTKRDPKTGKLVEVLSARASKAS